MKLKSKRKLIALVLIIIAPLALVSTIKTYTQRSGTSQWPHAKGTVLFSGVEQQKRYKKKNTLIRGKGYDLYYVQRIKYSYDVNGSTYQNNHFNLNGSDTGRALAFDGTGIKFWDKAQAHLAAQLYPRGRSVDVYYNPNNPEIASLSTANASFTPILFALGFLAFALLAILIAFEKINPENLPWRRKS